MRIAVGAIASCLLFSIAPAAWAQHTGPGARRPAIQQVTIHNRGDDSVIVVFSRPSERTPFYHASRLRRGDREVVPVPNLPSLRAKVLRHNEVEPRHGEDRGPRKRNMQLLGAIVGSRVAKINRNDNGDHAAAPRDDHHGQQDGNSSEHDNHDQQLDDYGRKADERTERETRNSHDPTYHLVLGNMLGSAVGDSKGRNPPARDDAPGEIDVIDADEGSGKRVVNGVSITVTTGDAEGVEVDPDLAGPDTSVAIGTDPAPANAAPRETAAPCYCGPDMTAAYVEALQRVHDRIDALPGSEKGLWNGVWFLDKNGGSLDERVRPVPLPGQAADPNNPTAMLCPSGPCANLPGLEGPTMSLFGICLAEHIGNDIMYGYVASRLGLPDEIADAGAHYNQYMSYGVFEPDTSHAAYDIARNIATLEGEFTEQNVGELFRSAEFSRHFQSMTKGEGAWDINSAVDFIRRSYPALADCPRCPTDATQPGTMLRDWSKSAWQMENGSLNYPPGFDPDAPQAQEE